MTFHMDFGARQRSRKGRRATVMPLWLVVALVASLLVACCLVTLIGVLTLMAAAGSIVIGSVLALAFLAVVNTMTPVAFLVLAARCVGVALVARVIPRAFEVLILCEAAFYLFYRFRSRRWRQVRAYGPRISKEERWMHFQRVLDTSPDMEAFLRGWFINQPPLAAIRRENVVEWLAWAFFCTSALWCGVACSVCVWGGGGGGVAVGGTRRGDSFTFASMIAQPSLWTSCRQKS